jgi:hypothetical protein
MGDKVVDYSNGNDEAGCEHVADNYLGTYESSGETME